MEADHSSESSESAYVTHHCSVTEATKLIPHPFDGDKRKLREFIENEVAFDLVHPSKHAIFLKICENQNYRRREVEIND